MDLFHRVLYAVFLTASVVAVLMAAIGYIAGPTVVTP